MMDAVGLYAVVRAFKEMFMLRSNDGIASGSMRKGNEAKVNISINLFFNILPSITYMPNLISASTDRAPNVTHSSNSSSSLSTCASPHPKQTIANAKRLIIRKGTNLS